MKSFANENPVAHRSAHHQTTTRKKSEEQKTESQYEYHTYGKLRKICKSACKRNKKQQRHTHEKIVPFMHKV